MILGVCSFPDDLSECSNTSRLCLHLIFFSLAFTVVDLNDLTGSYVVGHSTAFFK